MNRGAREEARVDCWRALVHLHPGQMTVFFGGYAQSPALPTVGSSLAACRAEPASGPSSHTPPYLLP